MAEALASLSYNEDVPVHQEDLYLEADGPKKDTRSKLHLSQLAAGGEPVNACPYGCTKEDCDEHGWCKHLIGFTDPENRNVFYPRVWVDHVGGISTKVRRIRPVEAIGGDDPRPVLKKDKRVRITTCHRVYREDGEAPEEPKEDWKAAKARFLAENPPEEAVA